jgi:imidazole glycerol-phosphate synthase subunit HisH
MIAIIDYGMGNPGSVKRKLDRIGAASVITADHNEIHRADKLILPGVGHFASAVKELKEKGLWEVLNEEVMVLKKSILGICLGMQLMARHSEEGNEEGLGWFDADVVRFRVKDTLKYKVPHIGWNQVNTKKPSILFNGVDMEQGFYFVHSYHLICHDPSDILNYTTYEYPFVSAVQKDNISGVQYHPEKSHDAGKQLLRNFAILKCSDQE